MDDQTNVMCLFSLDRFLNTIVKKWGLLILNEIGNHKKIRFSELNSELKGISPSTLSSMLKILEENGLIERKLFNEIPPRVEYSLSKHGQEFREALRPLIKWTSNLRSDNIAHCSCSLVKHGTMNQMQKLLSYES